MDTNDEGNCKGSINKHFGKVICYVEQPTSCSDARDSVEYAGEKYSALACTVGGKNAMRRNTSIAKILLPSLFYTTPNTFCFLLIDNMMFQMMDQTMDPVKAQAMELEKDLGQVKILRNNNLHHG